MQLKNLDFASVLASSIHDMKNSLGMLLNALDEIVDHERNECRCTPDQVAQLQYEAKRVNDNLIQLLAIYKVENKFYSAAPQEMLVRDFLEDSFLTAKPLLDHKRITVTVECDPDLVGYFDRDLVAGLIDNVVTNAARYTGDRITLSAQQADGYLELRVEDNGSGFPAPMLTADFSGDRELDMLAGRTKLGIFFCAMVASLHTSEGREGYIKLSNRPEGGGRFSLFLP
jgi:two-component system sensor histidine kinase SenX3